MVLATALAVAACNTVDGFKKDFSEFGDSVGEKAEQTKAQVGKGLSDFGDSIGGKKDQ